MNTLVIVQGIAQLLRVLLHCLFPQVTLLALVNLAQKTMAVHTHPTSHYHTLKTMRSLDRPHASISPVKTSANLTLQER